jgi:FtsP/CotA-like multicopper oxidase with cupredoxin domain
MGTHARRNDGAQIHPMHLHGYNFEVVAEDGFVLPKVQRSMADTLMIGARPAVRPARPGRLPGRVGVPLPHPCTWRGRRACKGW